MSGLLSPKDRQKLFRLISGLPPVQFNELLYSIGTPPGIVPPSSTAQGERVMALLQWVEAPTGCEFKTFLEALELVAPGAFQVEPSALQPPAQVAAPATLKSSAVPDVARLKATQQIAPPLPQTNTLMPAKPDSTITVDLGSGVELKLVYVPEGRFWMGSSESELERTKAEGPQHKVTVPAFYMGQFPVTQEQWRAVSLLDDVERHLSPSPSEFKGDDLPVEQVNWHEALEFCNRLPPRNSHPFRLPSEAEWEYACRAGTNTPFHFGDTTSTEQANYNGNYTYGNSRKGEYREKTTPVGNFLANQFGLYDMHGNIWEWCEDDWHKDYDSAPNDGRPWLESESSKYRILRGGSWVTALKHCRSAYRGRHEAERRSHKIGFRLCCSVPRT